MAYPGAGAGMDALIAANAEHKEKLRRMIDAQAVVPIRDFARLTGTPESAVVRAWKDGGLPCAPNDCIPIADGVVALCSIPGALRRARSGCPAWLVEFDSRARSVLGLPERDPEDVGGDDPGDDASELKRLRLALLKSQTAQNLTGAKKKEFELQVKKGEFVKTAEVELDAAEAATNVISVLNELPARIASACVGLSAPEIEARATAEINKAVESIQRAAFTGDWR